MRNNIAFDVFLCHNSLDKSQVLEIASVLKQMGLRPWLDVWEMPPGISWQRVLEQQIPNIRSVAVFVGHQGLGPWQEQEIEAFLREFARRECRIIPVLLKDAPVEPKLPLFLNSMTWVDFRQNYPHPMSQLVWGITGKKPQLEHLSAVQPKSLPSNVSYRNSLLINRKPTTKPQRLSKRPAFNPTEATSPERKSTISPTYLLKKTGLFQFLAIAVWLSIGYFLGESMNSKDLLPATLMAGSIGGATSGLLLGIAWQSVSSQAPPEETYIKFPAIGLVSGILVWLLIHQSLSHSQISQYSSLLGLATGCAFVSVFIGYLLNKRTHS